ncbi:hypothetical protein fugu_008214 [Takifugu bimaculatus]|uniref:Protein RRP5 homolog n=1 Tax=Takifugu bimaculatus TaxID=433685 RepID=A0A4Z2B0Q4_9TELE|nr:hypothetical protein fugu_008214 [Takifugu bimaculatus]
MASVEEDFPRGGTVAKPTPSKIVVQRTDVDNLFQSNEESETKKRKGTLKDDGKKIKKPKTGKEKEETLTLNASAKNVEILHIKNVREGMLLLGCVKDVADFEVTVSLPCGLQGFLSIRNISDSYTKMLSEQLDSDDMEDICSLPDLLCPGMIVRCAVAKLDTSKGGNLSIQLSINPKLVNKALTTSSLNAGMVLSGCVESVEDHGYIVDIGIKGTNAFLPKKKGPNNQEDLKVGQYVTSTVEAVKNEGRVVRLSVSQLNSSQACIRSTQGWNLTNLLPGLLVNATIKKVTKHGLSVSFLSSFTGQVDFLHMEPKEASSYKEGDEVRACVLYVEPSTRLVALSLRSYLLQPGIRVDPCPPGDDRVGEVVKSCKMTTVHHMSGAMLELPDKTMAFAHKNHLREPKAQLNENRLLAMPEHTCRILDFSLMDNIYFVSLRKSVIDKPFFRYHDLQAGQVVEGTVTVLLAHGMVVHLADHIKGLVPRTHLSDILLKNPEKKYMEGMKVKCRVLSVEPEHKKLFLTRKKALVESSLPLFRTISDARPGCVSHGYIVCIKDFGCIVRFYNDVKGLVPLSELSSEPISQPKDFFYIGQVLKTKVLQCDREKAKLLLSFKGVMEGAAEQTAAPKLDCKVGEKLEAKVLKKMPNGLEVAILPEEIRAYLPTMHLSDHLSNCPLLWECLQEGDSISNLIYINRSHQNIAMADRFISDTKTIYQLGQTVIAKVTNLDEEKRRFLVTLKISEVISPVGDVLTRLINGLQERKAMTEMSLARASFASSWPALSVGQRLKLTVNTATDNGATFVSDELHGATIQASKHHVTGMNLVPGQKVTAVILHIDLLSTCVHVSILSRLLGKKRSLNEGSKYTATVEHINQDFAVIFLDNTAHLTVIQTSSHLNHTDIQELKLGMSLTVELIEASCEKAQGLPLVAWERSAPKRQNVPSASQKGYCFGEVVQAKVKSVKPTLIQVTLEDGSTGTVHVSEFHPDRKVLEVTTHPGVTGTVELLAMVTNPRNATHPESVFKVGQAVYAKVVERSTKPQRFILSLTGVTKLEKGAVTLGMVVNIDPQKGLLVKLPFGGMGTVAITDLADAYRPNPLGGYSKNQILRFFLLGNNNGKWQLSLRPSRLNAEAKTVKDPEILSVDELKEGQIIRGYIKSVEKCGIFIRLSRSIVGRTELHHSTKYVCNNHKILSEHLPPSTLITTKILSIDTEEELVSLSLLPKDTGKSDVLPESLGLPLHLFEEEKTKCEVQKRNNKRKLSESEQVSKKKKKKKSKADGNDSGVEVYFREDDDDEDDAKKTQSGSIKETQSSAGLSRLQVAAGFSWDVGLNSLKPLSAVQESESSDEEEPDKTQKKSRHELEQEKKAAEKALMQREAELMDPGLQPEDAAAFERLLLASPNSSLLWLQYMAHHLQATQIEQARAVAERALKTISFREEQEKLNVWVALLNLENMYGTEESLKKVFERALQFCEPMPVYQQLADIYTKSEKMKEAESLYKTMVKRFRQHKAVWLSYGTFLLQRGQSDAANSLLQRALKSMPSKESVDVIAKFAQLEFRYGDAERGRTMFDKVLTSYPKRTDLWSVFIDLMIKHGSQKDVRELFDRVIHLSVSVKKIKFFFKRYLEYEKKHGTPQSVQAVKEKAVEFVESKGVEASK